MERPFFPRIFRRSSQEESAERQWRQQKAQEQGPPTFLQRIARPLYWGNQEYLQEEKHQRYEVGEQYRTSKNRWVLDRRRAERELTHDLDRQQSDIERYYRLKKLSPDDPRLPALQRRADEKIAMMTRQARRAFKRQWDERLRDLQRDRDLQYRDVRKNLNRRAA